MKIVVVDTTIDEALIGGAHLFLPVLIKGLVEKGHEVHLVTKDTPNTKVLSALQQTGAYLHSNIWNKNWYVEKTAPKLAAWVNEQNPDVYLISASGDIAWVALPFLNSSIATITIGHTDSETFYLPARHYQPFVTTAIGVSPQVCEQYESNCKIAKHNIHWIPYGVAASSTLNNFSGDAKINLVYAGRIEEEQKRISDLALIINALSDSSIDYQFIIIGDGPEMNYFKEKASKEVDAGRVVLKGWLPNAEVLAIFQQSEVFILTSAYEGFCIALTESMANGCCPVVTDIRSGNGELIMSGENGFIHPIGDTQSFVATIKDLIKNKDNLFRLRTNAWQTGKQFSIETMVNKYEDVFKQSIHATKNNQRNMQADFPLMSTCRSRYPLWLRSLKSILRSIRA